MKLIVTTTLEDVSQEYLDWYIDRMRESGRAIAAFSLKAFGHAVEPIDEPGSESPSGTTVYEVIREEE